MDFLKSIAQAFSPEIVQLLGLVLLVAFFAVAGWLALQVGKNQSLKMYSGVLEALAQKAVELIMFAKWGDEYQTKAAFYEQKQAERQAAGDFYIDARMLYVLDKLEEIALAKFGTKVEFDDLLPLAEAKYRELKAKGVFDPPVDDVTKPPLL